MLLLFSISANIKKLSWETPHLWCVFFLENKKYFCGISGAWNARDKHSMQQSALRPNERVHMPTNFSSTYTKYKTTLRCPRLLMVRRNDSDGNTKDEVAHVECYFLDSRRKDSRVFLVDAALWRRSLSMYHWFLTVNPKSRKTYVACGDYQHPNFLHRMVYKLVHGTNSIPVDMVVDHVRGNTLDNRNSQLQLATRSENAFNKDKPRKYDKDGTEVAATSQFTGVSVQEHTLKDGRKRKRYVAEFKLKEWKNKRTKSFSVHKYGSDKEAEKEAARWRNAMLQAHVRPEYIRLNNV